MSTKKIAFKEVNRMITKEMMECYVEIQYSGTTNMFDINRVVALSCGVIKKSDCLDIMKNYAKYLEEFDIDPEEYDY
jgi:hypothetical protein